MTERKNDEHDKQVLWTAKLGSFDLGSDQARKLPFTKYSNWNPRRRFPSWLFIYAKFLCAKASKKTQKNRQNH